MLDSGLAGKTCVVTGGASGIGLATVALLAEQGANVVASDLPGAALDAVPEPPASAGALLRFPADAADPAAVDALLAATLEAFGQLDVLVHCAGIYTTTPLDETDLDGWDRVLSVNLRGSWIVARAAIDAMVEHGDGRIVLFGSFASRTGGLRASAPYAASRAGVAGLTRNLAQHAGPRGVRVNCIHPGFTDTPMNAILGEQARADAIRGTPLRRLAVAEEMASMAVVLVSDLSSYVHGVQLDVNGGMYMA